MAQAVKVSDMLPKREIDQSAETIKEIVKNSGLSASQAAKLTKVLVEEGRVKRVWKKVGETLCAAYIPIKK